MPTAIWVSAENKNMLSDTISSPVVKIQAHAMLLCDDLVVVVRQDRMNFFVVRLDRMNLRFVESKDKQVSIFRIIFGFYSCSQKSTYTIVLGYWFGVSEQMQLLNNNVFQICFDYTHKGSELLINSPSNQDESCYMTATEV